MHLRQRIMVLALVLSALAAAEIIGPFTSTTAAGAAPQCNAPLLHQRFPAAAFGKSVYLAVWADGERSTVRKGSDIYCARIDSATGQSLDPSGILICDADYNQSHPAVAFDGVNFMVVWEDLRSNTDYDVYGARVSESGQVLDPDGFAISAIKDTNQSRPVVGFSNGNYFVAWNDARRYPVYCIYGSRVTTAGSVLDLDGVVIDAEDPLVIASKFGTTPRKNLGRSGVDDLKSNYSVSISSSGSGCNLAWVNLNTANWHYQNLKVCKINAATGAFITSPQKITGAGTLVQDVSAHCVTPQGISLGILVGTVGYSHSPNFFCQRFDSNLVTADVVGSGPREYDFNLDGGTANTIRGQNFFQKYSAAYDGKTIVNALEACWWKVENASLSKAIILMRSSLTQDTLLDQASPILVDEVTVPVGATESGAVSWPFLASGPNSTVLLLYEKNFGVDNQQITGRILRENE